MDEFFKTLEHETADVSDHLKNSARKEKLKEPGSL